MQYRQTMPGRIIVQLPNREIDRSTSLPTGPHPGTIPILTCTTTSRYWQEPTPCCKDLLEFLPSNTLYILVSRKIRFRLPISRFRIGQTLAPQF